MAKASSSLALRFFQIAFSAVVLGLSICAVRWQYYHAIPSTNGYGCFIGALGCVVGLIGLIALWFGKIGGLFMFIVDGITAILFLGGGIAFAVGLHGVDCSSGIVVGTWFNKLISGGCIYWADTDDYQCGHFAPSDVERRCRMAEANTVFIFLGFLMSLLAAILCMSVWKSNRPGTRSTV